MKLLSIKTMFATGLFALALGLSSSKTQAQQLQRIRVVDPIMKLVDSTQAGLSNYPVILKDNFTQRADTFHTNSQGYVDIVTDVKENESKNNLNVRISRANNGVSFLYDNDASIEIYDLLGQRVKTLHGNNLIWDLTNENNVKTADGVYIYRIFDKQANNKVIAKGKLMNLGRENIGHSITQNLENKVNASRINKETLLTTKRYRLEIRDELTSSIGEFYDIVDEADSLQGFKGTSENYLGTAQRGVYEMLFNFQIDLADGFLTYLKNCIQVGINNNGDSLAIQWPKSKRLPLKVFYNRAQAPHPYFIDGLERVLNEIEDSTQIPYRGFMLPRLNLYQEVLTNDEGDIDMNYSETTNRVNPNWAPAPPGSGLPAGLVDSVVVFINRNEIIGTVIPGCMHEYTAHATLGMLSEPIPNEDSYPIYDRRRKAIIQGMSLSDFYNFSKSRRE